MAKEQEMKAFNQEMQAKVIEAQAEVPHALAIALKEGRIGVMDYYNMNNVLADTQMRESISKTGPGDNAKSKPEDLGQR